MLQPLCPRCGYDQSGAVASWEVVCPVRGVCSECGLDFEWGDMLDPRRIGPRWSYEHGGWSAGRRWVLTSARAVAPGALWRELEVAHEIRRGRLCVFMAWWLVVLATGYVAVLPVVTVLAAPPWMRPSNWVEWVEVFTWVLKEELISAEGLSAAGSVMLLGFVPPLLMALWMSVLDSPLRMARIRKVHLLRGVAYSTPGAVMVPAGAMVLIVLFPRDAALWILGLAVAYQAWVGWWWQRFLVSYLRLDGVGVIIGVMMLLTVLGTMALPVAIWVVVSMIVG
jgi:hypothetical protein